MIRLFLPPEKLTSNHIIIDGENARYLSLVLRVRPNESLTIFDGIGRRYLCRVLQVHKKEVVAEKISTEQYSAESPVAITLAQGLPKADKMEYIIQKSTELGVSRIIPLITERSQVKHTEKIDRWRKIALSAAQQCGREKIPEVCEPIDFRDFLIPSALAGEGKGEEDFSHSGIIFSEEKKDRNLKKILSDFQDIKNITLLIGPEGGFTHEELQLAIDKGFAEASLGARILRTETAPITAISIIQYELGDMG